MCNLLPNRYGLRTIPCSCFSLKCCQSCEETIVQKAILVDRYKKLCYKPSLKQKIKEALAFNPFEKKEKLLILLTVTSATWSFEVKSMQ